MDLDDLQIEVTQWARHNFPNAKPYQPLLGAVEEIGELAHAHLKDEQGIRGGENHYAAKVDAVADAVIYLAHYCALNEIPFGLAVSETWSKVRQRDWIESPDTAHEGV